MNYQCSQNCVVVINMKQNDFIGKVFDDMEVLELDHITNNHIKVYKVRCIKCGHMKLIQQSGLKKRETTKHSNKHCGIYLEEYDENIGKRFDDVTIIKLDKITKDGYRYITRCNICGVEHSNLIHNIKCHYGTKHNSCRKFIKDEKYMKRFKKIYDCMRYRTTNPKYTEWEYYGGRDISSDYFKEFITFYNEMYDSYVKHVKEFGEKNTTLDRIDPDGNYETSNCRWATCKEQANNQRKHKQY